MKENLKKELIDLRIFDNPTSSVEIIKSIISNENIDNEAFYIVDLEDICNKHINWISKLPRVEPRYAVKCNTDIMLLKLLAYLGAGFDCASKHEIQTILNLGVPPHRIIYANPCKEASNIKFAYKMGVDYMTFDNEAELYKIKENHANAKCVLRIITNDVDAVCRFSNKFGADMDTSMHLIEIAMKLKLDLVGISFHVGSGQMSPQAFTEPIENARKLFDYAREEFGCKMHLLDLGGGFPGSSGMMDLFDTISMEINRALNEFFPSDFFSELNGTKEGCALKIIAEPGRYYASSAFTLCVNIIAKRVTNQSSLQQKQDKEALANKSKTDVQNYYYEKLSEPLTTELIDTSKSIMYYINDGIYASFNCLFYDHAECYPIVLTHHPQQNSLFKSSIWGPTCDGLDCVLKECYLPKLEVGEYLIFNNMGAYTISGAVAFNGIPLARCIYIASTSWETIKEAYNDQIDESLFPDFKESSSSGECSTKATPTFTRILSSLSNQQFQKQNINNYQDDQEVQGCSKIRME